MKSKSVTIAVVILMILAACSKTPSGVIKPGKMAELMADIHTGEAVAETSGEYRTDSLRQLLKQSVLAKHDVTSEQFDESLYWYGQHVDLYMEVNENTMKILEQRLADAEKVGNTKLDVKAVYTEADSAVVWSSPSALRLSTESPMYNATFALRSDRGWERGDAYTLAVRQVKNSLPVMAVIAVSYDNGTTEYVDATYQPGIEGTQHLTLYLDSTRVARHVFGSVSVPRVESDVNYLDSMSLTRTRTTSRAQYLRASQHEVISR